MLTQLSLQTLQVQLGNLTCFAVIDSISSIPSGQSHHCFKVNCGNHAYFAKYLGESAVTATNSANSLASDLPSNEVNCALAAAAQGIAPAVFFSNDDWLVTDFIDAQSLLLVNCAPTHKIMSAIQLMTQHHQLQLTLPVLDITATLDNLITALNLDYQSLMVLAQIKQQLLDELIVSGDTVCHGDVNFTNILVAEQAWLIDFECACLADVEFDLAMFIAINDLTPASIRDVCALYQNMSKGTPVLSSKPSAKLSAKLAAKASANASAKASATASKTVAAELSRDLSIDKVTRYLSFSYLINALWYLVAEKENTGKSYRKRAEQQLQCFDQLQFFAKPITPLLIE